MSSKRVNKNIVYATITVESLINVGFEKSEKCYIKKYSGGTYEQIMLDEIGIELALLPSDDCYDEFDGDVYDYEDLEGVPFSSVWFDSIRKG